MKQPDLFAGLGQKTVEGEALKKEIFDTIESKYASWLRNAREAMIALAAEQGEVSSDDCWKTHPVPTDAHPSIMAAVFKDHRFVRVGAKASSRPSTHARYIGVYGVKGQELK